MILMAFISARLCYKRSKIDNDEEKGNYEKKFNVIVSELKSDQLPMYYFIFFIRRFLLMIFINFVRFPTLRIILSSTLELSVKFI